MDTSTGIQGHLNEASDMSLINLIEVSFLILSAAVLGVSLLRLTNGRNSKRVLRIGAVLALGFIATYIFKLFAQPVLKYPVDESLRGLYLSLLVLHAISIPVAIVTGSVGLVMAKLKRRIRFEQWVRTAVVFWIIAATSGTMSAVLLYRALAA